MPSTTFNDFGGGMDQRSSQNTSKGKAFWLLNNCHPTTGRKLKKRPSWALQGVPTVTDEAPIGLATNGVTLYTFSRSSHGVTWPALTGYEGDPETITCTNLELDGHSTALARVYFARLFAGFFFVIAEDSGGTIECHYLDGATTNITDVNAPSVGKTAVIAEQKIWVPDGDKVRYCATGDPRDWTTGGDAGFIPVAQNSPGSDVCSSVGLYQGNLVVFMLDNIQIYAIDPDPANIALLKIIDGVGSDYPGGNAPVSADLFFNTTGGTRSLSTLELTDNVADVDVGSPVAGPMGTDIGANDADTVDEAGAVAYWFQGLGQYWVASSKYLWVYSFSRTSKLAAWSRYSAEEFGNPSLAWDLVERRGTVFYNDGSAIYMFDRTKFSDEISADIGPIALVADQELEYSESAGLAGAPVSDKVTICFWFATTNTNSSYSNVLHSDDGSTHFQVQIYNTRISVRIEDNTGLVTGYTDVRSTMNFADGLAHFFMYSRDGLTVEMTVDGADVITSVNRSTSEPTNWPAAGQLSIGYPGPFNYVGELANIWLCAGVALAPSVAANLSAFYRGSRLGAKLPANGAVTIDGTTHTPQLFVTGGPSGFLINAGTSGGTFTLDNGSLAAGGMVVGAFDVAPPAVEAMQNFDDYKKPGQRKLVFGGDVVCSGTPTVELLYEPDDTDLRTEPFETSGDSRRDGLLPIEANATEIAIRFTHARDEDFELDLFSVHYDNEALT